MIMKFKKHVTTEQREHLCFLLKQYKNEMILTEDELHNLEEWVSTGHSPYENPDFIYDDYCRLMDFISARRFLYEEYLEHIKHNS